MVPLSFYPSPNRLRILHVLIHKAYALIYFQITIDSSPPHAGEVHDGVQGSPDVDFQTSLTLKAHWEGFFDRESGVKFYQYSFNDHCLSSSDFSLAQSSTVVSVDNITVPSA